MAHHHVERASCLHSPARNRERRGERLARVQLRPLPPCARRHLRRLLSQRRSQWQDLRTLARRHFGAPVGLLHHQERAANLDCRCPDAHHLHRFGTLVPQAQERQCRAERFRGTDRDVRDVDQRRPHQAQRRRETLQALCALSPHRLLLHLHHEPPRADPHIPRRRERDGQHQHHVLPRRDNDACGELLR